MIMIMIMEKDVENYLANMVRFVRPSRRGFALCNENGTDLTHG